MPRRAGITRARGCAGPSARRSRATTSACSAAGQTPTSAPPPPAPLSFSGSPAERRATARSSSNSGVDMPWRSRIAPCARSIAAPSKDSSRDRTASHTSAEAASVRSRYSASRASPAASWARTERMWSLVSFRVAESSTTTAHSSGKALRCTISGRPVVRPSSSSRPPAMTARWSMPPPLKTANSNSYAHWASVRTGTGRPPHPGAAAASVNARNSATISAVDDDRPLAAGASLCAVTAGGRTPRPGSRWRRNAHTSSAQAPAPSSVAAPVGGRAAGGRTVTDVVRSSARLTDLPPSQSRSSPERHARHGTTARPAAGAAPASAAPSSAPDTVVGRFIGPGTFRSSRTPGTSPGPRRWAGAAAAADPRAPGTAPGSPRPRRGRAPRTTGGPRSTARSSA